MLQIETLDLDTDLREFYAAECKFRRIAPEQLQERYNEVIVHNASLYKVHHSSRTCYDTPF